MSIISIFDNDGEVHKFYFFEKLVQEGENIFLKISHSFVRILSTYPLSKLLF